MKKFMAVSLVGIGLACMSAAKAADVSKLDARVEAAHTVLHELMATPDKGIPLDIAAKAHCVLVVPGFKKGAFLVGAQYGQGVATCRTGTRLERPGIYPADRRKFRTCRLVASPLTWCWWV